MEDDNVVNQVLPKRPDRRSLADVGLPRESAQFQRLFVRMKRKYQKRLARGNKKLAVLRASESRVWLEEKRAAKRVAVAREQAPGAMPDSPSLRESDDSQPPLTSAPRPVPRREPFPTLLSGTAISSSAAYPALQGQHSASVPVPAVGGLPTFAGGRSAFARLRPPTVYSSPSTSSESPAAVVKEEFASAAAAGHEDGSDDEYEFPYHTRAAHKVACRPYETRSGRLVCRLCGQL